MTYLFVVRHGDTFETGERPRRIGCRSDPALTANGRRQAEALGGLWKDRGTVFTRAMSGPLRRTTDTAWAILAVQDDPPPIEHVEWLNEIDHGPDEGMVEEQVLARLGLAAIADWERSAKVPPEWTVDADRRMAAWQALYARPPQGDTLIVTSNGAARFALLAHLRWSLPVSLKLRTGAYGQIDCSIPAEPRLMSWDVRP